MKKVCKDITQRISTSAQHNQFKNEHTQHLRHVNVRSCIKFSSVPRTCYQ